MSLATNPTAFPRKLKIVPTALPAIAGNASTAFPESLLSVSASLSRVLELIENYYNKHFDYIIIICPTLQENSTYHAKEWIKNDNKVWLIEPKDNLYQWIQKLSELLRFLEVLFIIDDIIANKSLDKGGSLYYRIGNFR